MQIKWEVVFLNILDGNRHVFSVLVLWTVSLILWILQELFPSFLIHLVMYSKEYNTVYFGWQCFIWAGRVEGVCSQGAGRSSWASTLDLSNSSLGRCKIIQFVHNKIIIGIMSIILSDRWAHPHRLCFPNRTGYANQPSADEFKHGCCPTCQTLMSKPFLYNLVSESAVCTYYIMESVHAHPWWVI